MASEKTRSVDDQAKKALMSLTLLDEQRAEIKQLTDELNSRITRFQDWVATLPGRTETAMFLEDPDGDDDYVLHVVLRRNGKKWEVQSAYEPVGSDVELNYTSLIDASVKTKVYVIPFLPKLIDSMVESQAQMAKRIREVNQEFDEYAARLKIPAKEGK